jgi:hypothetical protein
MSVRLVRGKGGRSMVFNRADLSITCLCNTSKAVSSMIDCISCGVVNV